MSEDTGLNVGTVISNISAVDTLDKQADIFSRAMLTGGIKPSVEMIGQVIDKSLDDLGYARVFLLVLDQMLMMKKLGNKGWEQLRFTMKSSEKLRGLDEVLDQTKHLDATSLMLLKAKTAMTIQLLFLLRARIQDEGMPELRTTPVEVVRHILQREDLKERQLVVDLNHYGRGYWNIFVEILKEADFRSDDNVTYTTVFSDDAARASADGRDLVSSGKAGQGGKLSEAVIARMGNNIIKRLSLLLRSVKMYTSVDHPSISLGIESLLSTINDLLKDRESLTVSRIGSDLLVEDVRIKKKANYLDDFVVQLDDRNMNSLTFRKGISLDEVRAFVMIFAETAASIKGRGGVKGILDSKGVTHILVDQFKYGIIADDGMVEQKDDLRSDEKALENIVFSELVQKIKQGGAVGDISGEDVAKTFASLITGSYRKDQKSRVALAQMILTLDPSLADQALFSKGGLKDAMSWSTARTTIEQLLDDMARGGPEDRLHALDNLSKMVDLTISKNKDTTLTEIIERLSARVWFKERDLEVCAKLFETMIDVFRAVVVAHRTGMALGVARQFDRVRKQAENLPADKQDTYTRALRELAASALVQASDAETVGVLVRELDTETMSVVDNTQKILELLGTEEVVQQLLDGFKNPSRSFRNRCFQTLLGIGPRAYDMCVWKLKNLQDPGQFQRTGGDNRLADDSFYLARNCVDILAKLGGAKDVELLRTVAEDRDPRIRREVIVAAAKLDPEEAARLASDFLLDESREVIEAAITTLGTLQAQHAVPKLVDLFYSEESLRPTIINSIARIGGPEAEALLLPATKFRFGKHLGAIYRHDMTLRVAALKGMGLLGTEKSSQALRSMVTRLSNPFLRIFFFPLGGYFRHGDLVKAARDSLGRIEYRLKAA